MQPFKTEQVRSCASVLKLTIIHFCILDDFTFLRAYEVCRFQYYGTVEKMDAILAIRFQRYNFRQIIKKIMRAKVQHPIFFGKPKLKFFTTKNRTLNLGRSLELAGKLLVQGLPGQSAISFFNI